MAFRGRELLLTVRAQNQASAALRRVGQDVRAMGRLRDLQLRQGDLELEQMRRAKAAQASLNRIQDVRASGGAALDQRRQRLLEQEASIPVRRQRILDREVDTKAKIAAHEGRISSLRGRQLAIDNATALAGETRIRTLGQATAQATTLTQQLGTTLRLTNRQITLDERRVNTAKKLAAAHEKVAEQIPIVQEQKQARRAAQAAARRKNVDWRTTGVPEIDRTALNAAKAQVTEFERTLERFGRRQVILNTDMQVAEGKLHQYGTAVEATQRRLGRLPDTISRLSNRQKTLDVSTASAADSMRKYQRTLSRTGESLASIDRLTSRTSIGWQKLEADQVRHTNQVQNATNAHRVNEAALQQTAIRMRELNRAIADQKWENLALGARSISHVGRVMQLTGLVAVAGLGMAAKAAVDFARQTTLVATQTGAIGTGMETVAKNSKFLQQEFLKLGSDSTSSLEQINDTAYNLFSTLDQLGDTGFSGLKLGTNILRELSQAAMAGMTDMDVVGKGVVRTFASFPKMNQDVKTTREILNRMFAAVRFGSFDFTEFARSLEVTTPAANAAGQSFDSLAGTIAFLSKPLGINKAQIGYARLLEILSRGKMVKGLEEMGIRITDTEGNFKSLLEMITLISEARPDILKSDKAFSEFFKVASGTEGTIQARRAFVNLIKDREGYIRILNKTVTANTELQRSTAAMEADPANKLQKALGAVRVSMIEIGAAAVPVFADILKPLAMAARWFQSLNKDTKRTIGQIAAFSAVGLLLVGTFASIAGGVLAFAFALRNAGKFLGMLTGRGGLSAADGAALRAGTSFSEFGSQVGTANARLVRFGGVMTAIVVGLPLLIRNFDTASAAIGGMSGAVTALNIVFGLSILKKLAPVLLGLITKSGLLRKAIFGLALASKGSLIAIGLLSVGLSVLIRKIPYWEDAFKKLGSSIYDAFHSDDPVIPDVAPNVQEQIARIKTEFARLRDIGMTPNSIRMALSNIMPEIDEDAMDIYFASAARTYKRKQKDFQKNINKFRMVDESKKAYQVALARKPQTGRFAYQDTFQKEFDRVEMLREQAEKAPTYRNWLRFYKAQETLSKRATTFQIQAAEAVRDAQEAAGVGSVSNQSVLASVRNIEVLRLAAENAPSMVNWLAYYKAQATLSKKATSEQIQAAEATIKQIEQVPVNAAIDPSVVTMARRSGTNLSEAQVASIDAALRKADVSDAMRDLMSTDPQTVRSALGQLRSFAEEGGEEAGRVLGDAFGRTVRGQILVELGGLATDTRVTMKDMTNALNQAADSAADNMLSRFNELRDANKVIMGELFQGPRLTGAWADFREQWGIKDKPQDLIRDLRGQVTAFKSYQKQLAAIRKQGAPQGLIEEVTSLGQEGGDKLRAIAQMTKPQREAYFKLWQQSRGLVEKAATTDFNRELQAWQKQGQNMAIAIAAGIRQEDSRLREAFRGMFLQMFGGKAPGAGVRPVTVAQGNTSITVYASKGENLDATLRKMLFQLKNKGR